MSDQTQGPRPAMPVARTPIKNPDPQLGQPQAVDPANKSFVEEPNIIPPPLKHNPNRKPKKKNMRKVALGLTRAEIKKLNKLRNKNLKKKKRKPKGDKHAIDPYRRVAKHPALAAPYGVKYAITPKNPNRPLEMKNQLNAVLALTGVLKKPELVIFADLTRQLGGLARGSRRKVLDALRQVYP